MSYTTFKTRIACSLNIMLLLPSRIAVYRFRVKACNLFICLFLSNGSYVSDYSSAISLSARRWAEPQQQSPERRVWEAFDNCPLKTKEQRFWDLPKGLWFWKTQNYFPTSLLDSFFFFYLKMGSALIYWEVKILYCKFVNVHPLKWYSHAFLFHECTPVAFFFFCYWFVKFYVKACC